MFSPKFKWVYSIQECADLINKPHEDYPDRVNVTWSLLKTLIESKIDSFNSFDARTIHSIIFASSNFRGRWRECDVKVGKDTPPNFLRVPQLIEESFPVVRLRDLEPKKVNYLINWYKDFQMIHPFQDGNGRVGGVIVAVLSWDGTKLLAPLQ